jgi:Mycothiol maleylpyruvate isomerase N-terminal domain
MTSDRPKAARPKPDLLIAAGADGRELLAAAATGWARPVPHCPQWDAAEFVRHMGGILAWMARIVTTGQQVSRRDRDRPGGPGQPAGLGHLGEDAVIRGTFGSAGGTGAGMQQAEGGDDLRMPPRQAEGDGATYPVPGKNAPVHAEFLQPLIYELGQIIDARAGAAPGPAPARFSATTRPRAASIGRTRYRTASVSISP